MGRFLRQHSAAPTTSAFLTGLSRDSAAADGQQEQQQQHFLLSGDPQSFGVAISGLREVRVLNPRHFSERFPGLEFSFGIGAIDGDGHGREVQMNRWSSLSFNLRPFLLRSMFIRFRIWVQSLFEHSAAEGKIIQRFLTSHSSYVPDAFEALLFLDPFSLDEEERKDNSPFSVRPEDSLLVWEDIDTAAMCKGLSVLLERLGRVYPSLHSQTLGAIFTQTDSTEASASAASVAELLGLRKDSLEALVATVSREPDRKDAEGGLDGQEEGMPSAAAVGPSASVQMGQRIFRFLGMGVSSGITGLLKDIFSLVNRRAAVQFTEERQELMASGEDGRENPRSRSPGFFGFISNIFSSSSRDTEDRISERLPEELRDFIWSLCAKSPQLSFWSCRALSRSVLDRKNLVSLLEVSLSGLETEILKGFPHPITRRQEFWNSPEGGGVRDLEKSVSFSLHTL